MLSTNETSIAIAGGFLGALFFFIIIVSIIYYILYIIAGWKIFKKAGEEGWKAIIPIYNVYIFFKIVGMKNWFWAMLAFSFVIGFITSLLGQGTTLDQVNFSTGAGIFSGILLIILGIFSLVVEIIYAYRTSRIFGHGVGFTLGLIFLPGIFLLILGFGRSKYSKKIAKEYRV